MKPFHLDPDMKTTMRGVFYPTGYMVLMFPGEQQARDAGKLLADAGIADDHVALITPDDFRRQIVGATGDDDMLPSAGTEGDTVRRFTELAGQGHYGVMIHAPSSDESDRVMAALKDCEISYGQKYRRLVIEDIVE
ncbi:MAG TPA: hypothetical protein VIL30_23605 [Ramlibacter sp.]